MDGALLICTRCYRIWGCERRDVRRCDGCTAHDCPLLPAPSRAEGLCERCRPLEAMVAPFEVPEGLGGWAGRRLGG